MLSLPDTEIINTLQESNFVALLLMGISSIPVLYVAIKWMFKFQREYADIYVEENTKLRAENEKLDTDCNKKSEEILELKTKIGRQENVIKWYEYLIISLGGTVPPRPDQE